MLYNDCTPEGPRHAASSIRCVLCDTGSVMFSIHSGIYFKFTTDRISTEPSLSFTDSLGAQHSNSVCQKLLIKQNMFVLKRKNLSGHLDPWRMCNKWKRSCKSCNTLFLCRYFWLSLPLFFPRIWSTKTFQLTQNQILVPQVFWRNYLHSRKCSLISLYHLYFFWLLMPANGIIF